ncbi:MAG TPA: DUF3618 domain-containing protein [Jatrophihabitans sp.]|nr:DUF3618 domain-containing protein [Jatrophihabitans sp.]
MSNPEAIQREIERTRATLSDNVDRLTEKVSPPRVVGRQVDRAKSRATNLRDRVMGSAGDGSGLRGAGDSLGSAAGSAKDTVSSATEAVSAAPQALRQQAQGNPLAAGLVAFGVGMIVSSLLPASQPEQQLAAQAEEKAKELAEPVKQAGQQLAEDLKPAAQEAVEQVKSSAQDAAQQTTEQAKSATEDVKAPLQQ